jgi:hypothetical protein
METTASLLDVATRRAQAYLRHSTTRAVVPQTADVDALRELDEPLPELP